MNDIKWLDEALADLDYIGSYIALDNERASGQIVRRIVEAVAMLSWYPKLGRVLADGDTRRLTITGTPYIAFYRLRDQIEILAVLHGAQKWPDRSPIESAVSPCCLAALRPVVPAAVTRGQGLDLAPALFKGPL
jgi:toxin ParE1/3/4